MHIRDTVPIAFSVGTYGTYLEWALTMLCTDQDIEPPFTDTGSSHAYLGNHLANNQGWLQYVKDNKPKKFVRFHPKEQRTQSLSQNLEQVLESVDKMIYIYPGADSVLLVINNWLSKVRADWWSHDIVASEGLEKIHDNWPSCRGLEADQIPVWVRREFLSHYLMPSWYDQVEWYHPRVWQSNRCATITVDDLLDNFESCMDTLQRFAGLTFCKRIDQILPYHQTMLGLQKYRDQDLLCKKIILATINDGMFDWTNQDVPLPSQAWIQWQLRNYGWELQCHGLDIWPTNSVHLKQLLYPTTQ